MTNLYYFSRSLALHQQINLQLEQIIKEKQWPTLIRLSYKASLEYTFEAGKLRISENVKYHLGPRCLVKIEYNQPVNWFEIETQTKESSHE